MNNINFEYSSLELCKEENIDFITLEDLIENVGEWKRKEENITQFLSTKSPSKKGKAIIEEYSENPSLLSKKNLSGLGLSKVKKNYLQEHMKKQKL